MRYFALACDYDGTLATNGYVEDSVLLALQRLVDSGRKLILVTGRQLDDLYTVFPQLELFDYVVVENGAVLYQPASREEKLLAPAPPKEFIEALRKREIHPLAVGRVIVATWHPHETLVLEIIRQLGLELQVIFNKGAVMVLPSGVNKATGLTAALQELGLSPHNVVGVGDAENDHAFLRLCECAVAVRNALPMVKESADLVTMGDHGTGVIELIERIDTDDLRSIEETKSRRSILLGTRVDGQEVYFPSYGRNLLIAGASGSGKSTLATGFLEQLLERHYQFCIIDPEGDYETLPGATALGTSQRAPEAEEVLHLLAQPETNAVVNLVGLPVTQRPDFLRALLPRLQELRARNGRPHWILIDEAHHLLGSTWAPAEVTLPQALMSMVFITVHPQSIAPALLSAVDAVVAVGEEWATILDEFSAVLKQPPPALAKAEVSVERGEMILWQRYRETEPFRFRPVPSHIERRRHRRKYAEGELEPDRSFYFRGAEGKLNLRAQNLFLFKQLADGVDDETWLYHLRRRDYSQWIRAAIKDDILAEEVEQIEAETSLSASASRIMIKDAIDHHYTLPVE